MHQLRSAHLQEALQESVVANVGKQEGDLFIEVLRVADQPLYKFIQIIAQKRAFYNVGRIRREAFQNQISQNLIRHAEWIHTIFQQTWQIKMPVGPLRAVYEHTLFSG